MKGFQVFGLIVFLVARLSVVSDTTYDIKSPSVNWKGLDS